MSWQPKRLKHYPHFDRMLTASEAAELACDPIKVKQHAFFPFILYESKWRKFTARVGKKKSVKPREVKRRPIRYAARSDAYIFEYYRHILGKIYEDRLCTLGINEIPIAYRKLLTSGGKGKSNIDFAEEAISEIKLRRNCIALAMDVSSFFENLEHDVILCKWRELLDVARLPDDHFAVYKAICRYRTVDRDLLYKRLGVIGDKPDGTIGFLINERDLNFQICSIADFREKVCGEGGKFSSLVSPVSTIGVPQGAPLSDLLANLYLIDFDKSCSDFCKLNDIYYRRYSDDVLFILPPSGALKEKTIDFAQNEITKAGRFLKFKRSKTRIHRFVANHESQMCLPIQTTGNFEYLGFQYDGKCVLFRDSTMSNFYRKITRSTYVQARICQERLPDHKLSEILEHDMVNQFIQRFGRIKDFSPMDLTPQDWTFYTYVKRSAAVFQSHKNGLARQVSHYKKYIRRRLSEELRARGFT